MYPIVDSVLRQYPSGHEDDYQRADRPERGTRFVRLSGEICRTNVVPELCGSILSREVQKSGNDVTIEEQACEQERWLS
jgi:hypothetical protein